MSCTCFVGADSMAIANMRDLTDKQWKTLDELIPEPPSRPPDWGETPKAVLLKVLVAS